MKLRGIIGLLIACASVGGVLVTGCVQEQESAGSQSDTQTQQPEPDLRVQERRPEVPYVPTPPVVVNRMLEMADVKGDDVLYDLGSGDGRIVITAAEKYGTRGTGVEINPGLVQESQKNAREAGVADRVEFVQQDLFETDLSEATVVTLYLLPEINLKLREKLLQELEPGTRIVSHDYDMGEWEPKQVEQVQSSEREHTLYYWVVPEEVPKNLN